MYLHSVGVPERMRVDLPLSLSGPLISTGFDSSGAVVLLAGDKIRGGTMNIGLLIMMIACAAVGLHLELKDLHRRTERRYRDLGK